MEYLSLNQIALSTNKSISTIKRWWWENSDKLKNEKHNGKEVLERKKLPNGKQSVSVLSDYVITHFNLTKLTESIPKVHEPTKEGSREVQGGFMKESLDFLQEQLKEKDAQIQRKDEEIKEFHSEFQHFQKLESQIVKMVEGLQHQLEEKEMHLRQAMALADSRQATLLKFQRKNDSSNSEEVETFEDITEFEEVQTEEKEPNLNNESRSFQEWLRTLNKK